MLRERRLLRLRLHVKHIIKRYEKDNADLWRASAFWIAVSPDGYDIIQCTGQTTVRCEIEYCQQRQESQDDGANPITDTRHEFNFHQQREQQGCRQQTACHDSRCSEYAAGDTFGNSVKPRRTNGSAACNKIILLKKASEKEAFLLKDVRSKYWNNQEFRPPL